MALDLMEPVRPEVEGFVLDMLGAPTFRKAEFTETEDGHVRLRAPLTHELAETMPRWARSLAPIAERVAHMLGQAIEGKYTPATPLTSAKLRSAQAIVKARKTGAVGRATRDAAKQRPAAPVAPPLCTCPECGGPVTNSRHVLCEPCHRERISPRLGVVKLADIMEATGYSKGHCSTIRAGTWTPHVSRSNDLRSDRERDRLRLASTESFRVVWNYCPRRGLAIHNVRFPKPFSFGSFVRQLDKMCAALARVLEATDSS